MSKLTYEEQVIKDGVATNASGNPKANTVGASQAVIDFMNKDKPGDSFTGKSYTMANLIERGFVVKEEDAHKVGNINYMPLLYGTIQTQNPAIVKNRGTIITLNLVNYWVATGSTSWYPLGVIEVFISTSKIGANIVSEFQPLHNTIAFYELLTPEEQEKLKQAEEAQAYGANNLSARHAERALIKLRSDRNRMFLENNWKNQEYPETATGSTL